MYKTFIINCKMYGEPGAILWPVAQNVQQHTAKSIAWDIENLLTSLSAPGDRSSLEETIDIWHRLASLMADICLNTNGNVCHSGCVALENFLNAELQQPTASKLRKLPGVEMMLSRASIVLQKMYLIIDIGDGSWMSLAGY
jgi:hypothetical protein